MKIGKDGSIGSKARTISWAAAATGYVITIRDDAGKVLKTIPAKHLSEAISGTRTMAKDYRLRMVEAQ